MKILAPSGAGVSAVCFTAPKYTILLDKLTFYREG